MHGQMRRTCDKLIAEDLLMALEFEWDALQSLTAAYKRAKDNFTWDVDQPDPATIALGVQAMALGVRTLCTWLQAIAEVTGAKYHNEAVSYLVDLDRTMLSIGLVIPDVMTL